MTATLGILFGIGFYELAIFGTIATVLVLAAVTITERRAPQRRVVHLKARYERSAGMKVRAFETLLTDHGLRAITIDQQLANDVVEFGAIADGFDDAGGEKLAANFAADTKLIGFEIRPQQA